MLDSSSVAQIIESNENDFPHLRNQTKSPKSVKHTISAYSKLE